MAVKYPQRVVSQTQLDRIEGAISGNYGIFSDGGTLGGEVTAQGSPSLTVDVAAIGANNYIINGAVQANAVGATSVTHGAADATNPRIDCVKVNTSGAVAIEAGVAAADPIPPSLAATEMALAYNLIGQNSTTVTAADIFDHRYEIQQQWGVKGSDVASAATPALGAESSYDITGTTGISALPARNAGWVYILQFDDAVTITHNGTSLDMVDEEDYTTAAGDLLMFVSEGSGNWRELNRHNPDSVEPGLIYAGEQLTEATTTSVTAVDLLTVSSLSIPATTPFMVIGNVRKSSGAAAGAALGLKLNTTTVEEATIGESSVWSTSADNEAQSGMFVIFIGSRITNYLRAGARIKGGFRTTEADDRPMNMATANMPTATITSVVIRGISGNAAVTLAVDEVYVFRFGVS